MGLSIYYQPAVGDTGAFRRRAFGYADEREARAPV
jgi:hypothetical protein